MRYQIFSDDKVGTWAVLFDRSPFCYGELSQEERQGIEEILTQNSLIRDEQIADAITHRSVRVRVKPQFCLTLVAPNAASRYDELPGYSYWDDPTPGEER